MAKKNKKPQKLKARQPRGFIDRGPADIRAMNKMMDTIKGVYEKYGFDPIETPMFEYTDCLGKFLPDTDRPNAGVFSVQDDDEQWMSLRYDLTAPMARHVAENFQEMQLPFRSYRAGYVFRNEKPGPGRFRQFMQFDADSVGAPGVQADAEMCMMMADTMEALGIARGDYVVRVNDRRILEGLLDMAGLSRDHEHEKRLQILRVIDKVDRLEPFEIEDLFFRGRIDKSGDFTPGIGLTQEQAAPFINLVHGAWAERNLSSENAGGSSELFDETGSTTILAGNLSYLAKRYDMNPTFAAGTSACLDIQRLCRQAGYGNDRIRVDPSCVRGLEYYTGAVFECELTFPVKNEKGEEVVFGSVGGGGRYDGLVKRFTGQEVPATGFSIGVSRLMTALKNLGKLDTNEVAGPVLVCAMDKDIESLGHYQRMVQDLRQAGIRAEMFQGSLGKFAKQLQYADRRNCPIAIIQGSDERATGKIQIKDMIEGKKEAAAIETNEEYRAARVGQYEVDAADLVAEVKKRLAEQAGDA